MRSSGASATAPNERLVRYQDRGGANCGEPMLTIRKSDDRGRTLTNWLDSRHTFSFGEFRDPSFVNFGALRVINEDRVAAGGGFRPHPHNDM